MRAQYRECDVVWLRFTCANMIKACYLSGLHIANCCASATSVTTDFGQCIKFENINHQDTHIINGAQFGLEIVMDLQTHEASGSAPIG